MFHYFDPCLVTNRHNGQDDLDNHRLMVPVLADQGNGTVSHLESPLGVRLRNRVLPDPGLPLFLQSAFDRGRDNFQPHWLPSRQCDQALSLIFDLFATP